MTAPDPRLAVLAELREALRELLGHVGGADPTARSFGPRWRRAERLTAELTGLAGELAELAPEDRAELARGLDDVLRLNAIATSLAQREAARVGHTLEGVRRALRAARDQRGTRGSPSGGPTGGSCNVAG